MATDNELITDVLESQYKAALIMLRLAIEKVPDHLWDNRVYRNPIWQLTFHTLWAAKIYLSASPQTFIPWGNAHRGAENLRETPTCEAHTATELLQFIDQLAAGLKSDITPLPLNKPSGFEWYPVSRLELHLINIRHIQHHTAQIIERLKAIGLTGFDWAIEGRDK